jgi:hypothetical protein
MMKNAVDLTPVDQSKRALWSRRIEQWKRSGKTQREFCAQHSIALATFQWWRARLRAGKVSRAEAQSLFVPLAVANEPVAAAGVIEVELRSGTRLRFEGEAARGALERLLAKVR